MGTPDNSLLIAEPHADTRELYRLAFSSAGWACIESAEGREALGIALQQPPTLFLIELRLPGIDGADLCETLRKDATTADVPVLMVTSESREHEIQRAHRSGANGILLKPLPVEAIVDAAVSLVEQCRTLRADVRRLRGESKLERDHSTVLKDVVEQTLHQSRARAHARFTTSTPDVAPSLLQCPICDRHLTYVASHFGGVNASRPERWDEFMCAGCDRAFEYRFRTKRLRQID